MASEIGEKKFLLLYATQFVYFVMAAPEDCSPHWEGGRAPGWLPAFTPAWHVAVVQDLPFSPYLVKWFPVNVS